jgi:hypothetical protein
VILHFNFVPLIMEFPSSSGVLWKLCQFKKVDVDFETDMDDQKETLICSLYDYALNVFYRDFQGEFHDQGDAKWMGIKGQLRGS